MAEIPTCRWGIVATGLISSWFVADLVLERDNPKARHVIQAIGSSSAQKGKDFAAKYCPNASPTIYGSYAEIYADPEVDCVYVGTPMSFHKKNCLDAIAAGKNVLCEKAFTINAKEAREVFDAAKKKGVYVAEAMWLRHRPMVTKFRQLLFDNNAIGNVALATSNFALPLDIPGLPATSRYKDPELGAGTLLDIGIYPLTWLILSLDSNGPQSPEDPKVIATQTHSSGVEATTSVILHYPSTGRQGVLTSTFMTEQIRGTVCRVQGSEGYIDVIGEKPSHPEYFVVYRKQSEGKFSSEKFEFPHKDQGFLFEADNTAVDIAAKKHESAIMPWKESIRVMELMDEIRRQGGTVYSQDKE
ncbi:dimeric dihydrodiol dehydrogenase [Myriangium duriaei CBS 260.36]|uniref:D-xylose 1-dehydrogenase (NADP(+), D-xylono-1,5-lactone-forming) n=1 Tax=Myriangium duriaei CBS 260.36 TaxID=1168546 RepID=A0A9P4IZZ8_9PEZI|nr:dimeric dihydrodiol dehydrogenase [Myriangium duriaei CBS 260.36]